MSGRILTPVFLAASLSLFGQTSGSQQQQQNPPANPPKLERRASEKTSGKEIAPPEEDTSIGNANSFSFNPLQAKKDIEVGNEYAKKHNFRAAANRFTDATKHNDQDAEAWLRLGEAQERLKDHQAAREAYSKYLEIASDAKNANDIRKRLDKLK